MKNLEIKPINNHIIVSDPETAKWLRSKLFEPLTEEKIKRNKDELKSIKYYFFTNKI